MLQLAFLIVVAVGLDFSKTSTVAANATSLAKAKKHTLSKPKTKKELEVSTFIHLAVMAT